MSPDFNLDAFAGPRARRVEGPSLLVATLEIQEAQFRRTVVLVAEHTSAGALGFVINRPSAVSLSQIFGESTIAKIPPQLPAWYGGPVESNQGLILHGEALKKGDTKIAEGISLSSVESSLETLILEETRRLKALEELRTISQAAVNAGMLPGFDSLYPYRYLSGYSGWGPGQLEDEIQAGAWLEIPLDRRLIFNTPWHNIWDRAIGGLGVTAANLAPPQAKNTWLN